MPKSQNMEREYLDHNGSKVMLTYRCVVSVKHSGKTYTIPVTQETTTQAFKDAISQLTRVPTGQCNTLRND